MENIKTLVDLRSEQELSGDIMKYNSTVFDSYGSLMYDVQKSKKTGRPKAVVPRKDGEGEAERCVTTKRISWSKGLGMASALTFLGCVPLQLTNAPPAVSHR